MGYTHYWECQPDGEQFKAAWSQFCSDTARILEAVTGRGVQLAGPDGTGQPEVSEELGVAFNGSEEFKEDYETFAIALQGRGHDFCKTGIMPYDLAVTAVLLRLHMLAPADVRLDSDGAWHDWKPARDLLTELFPEQAVPEDSPLKSLR